MSLTQKASNYTLFTIIVIVALAAGLVFYDVLFSKPHSLSGIIVDKIYVPARNAVGPNSLTYRRAKTYDYSISAEDEHQWIAFVKMENGKILKVNCHSNHYETKQVGDTLHFKEYTGDMMHIDYFSHNEEDLELEK